MRIWRYFLLLAITCGGVMPTQAAPIAKVELTDGTVFVRTAGGKQTIVAAGSSLEEGDTISTEAASYARLKFTDGSELAMRPSSSLKLVAYHFEPDLPARDNIVMRLVKGGLRTVTGLVGKRGNYNAYRMTGSTSTIGIRGTDFIARVCNSDCQDEKRKPEVIKRVVSSVRNPIVARYADGRGTSVVTSVGGKRRRLEVGEALFNGDTISVDADGFAGVVLSDETRVVLQGGSEYSLDSIVFNPHQATSDGISTRLLKGAMRVVTGLLAKRNPKSVEFSLTVATIGIRGTSFDVVCVPQAQSDPEAYRPATVGGAECNSAFYAQTREGAIEVSTGTQRVVIEKGQSGYADAEHGVARLLESTPDFLRDLPIPRPEDMAVNMVSLFGVDSMGHNQPGLYVEVKEGKVLLGQIDGQGILLGAGETGFSHVNGESPYRLNSSPSIIDADPYLRDIRVDPVACRP